MFVYYTFAGTPPSSPSQSAPAVPSQHKSAAKCTFAKQPAIKQAAAKAGAASKRRKKAEPSAAESKEEAAVTDGSSGAVAQEPDSDGEVSPAASAGKRQQSPLKRLF